MSRYCHAIALITHLGCERWARTADVSGAQVRGEHFSWEQARDMTFKDIAKNVEMYHAMLSRLFEQGAEDPESAAHAELVELLALKVCGKDPCHLALVESGRMQRASGPGQCLAGSARLAGCRWCSLLACAQCTVHSMALKGGA